MVYAFQPDFKGRIRGKSVSLRMKPVLAKVLETLSFLVRRWSVGTGLMIGGGYRGGETRESRWPPAGGVHVHTSLPPLAIRLQVCTPSLALPSPPETQPPSTLPQVRITFGTALFASIVVTFLAITVLLSSTQRSDNDNRRGGGGISFNFIPDLWFYMLPNRGYRYDDDRRSRRGEEGGMSLPEAIFSFVFGDGDPNQGFEEDRWRSLGRFIQASQGVVTAEEMAPFLDPPSSSSAEAGSSGVETDDAFVLPALIKFGGEPFVDEEGHLLYKFPSLQRTVLQRVSC